MTTVILNSKNSAVFIKMTVFEAKMGEKTNSLTPYTGVWGLFLQVKFANSLLALPAGEKTNLEKSLSFVE